MEERTHDHKGRPLFLSNGTRIPYVERDTSCPTVKVESYDKEGKVNGFSIINKADFDPKVHKEIKDPEEKKSEPKGKGKGKK